MSKYAILRLIICLLVSPLALLSLLLLKLKLFGLHNDLQLCIEAVDAAPSLPNQFVITLLAAEDHRNSIHPGVDPIAILRAMLIWVRTKRVQGASTIEQQLVRVVLAKYERTLKRKFREQMIAIALSCKRSKTRIAIAYLSIAFYGSGQYGVAALNRACGSDLNTATQESILFMVAKLKYPEPLLSSSEWDSRIHNRAKYIANRLTSRSKRPAARWRF